MPRCLLVTSSDTSDIDDDAFAVTETETRFWKIYPLFIP